MGVRSTVRRLGVNVVNSVSNAVGDDVVGRWVRSRMLRWWGAAVDRTASFHGGTYFSNPRNLRAGQRVFVNRNCYLDAHAAIVLGNDVVVGHNTRIVTSNHEIGPSSRRAGAVTARAVHIQDGAWLGADCIVLPGLTIGPGAIVAAGSVVTTDVEPDVLVAGVPAKVVRRLDHEPGHRPDVPAV